MVDAFKNHALTTITTAPSPAASGGSLVVASAAVFPPVPFTAVVWPSTGEPTAGNSEFVRVTAISGNTLTVTRTIEGPGAARTIAAGDRIAQAVTAAQLAALAAQVNADDVGYDVVILAGQSNMSDSGGTPAPTTYDTTDVRIWQWAGRGTEVGNIVLGSNPLLMPPPDGSSGVGPGMQFAREWIKRVPVNRSVLLVPTAVGGSQLTGGPWAVGGSYYNQAISLANAAIAAAGPKARVVAILWAQGEGDSVNGITQAAYAAAFDAMIAGFRANITGASTAPVVLGGMVPEWRNAPNGTSLQIHAAHTATPGRISNAFFVDGPTGLNEGTGGIHYNPKGQRLNGKSMCEALWANPAAPGQVTGLAGTPADTQMGLAWNATSAIPFVSGYEVQYKANASGTWLPAGSTSTNSFTVTGLTNGTPYDFRVRAVNSVGVGAWSATETKTPALVSMPDPLYLVDAKQLSMSDGAALTTWTDLSTNATALDLTQATAAEKPTYRATGINGNPSIEFDGGDSLAQSTAASAIMNGSGEYTIVAVFSATNVSAIRGIVALRDDAAGMFHLVALTDGTLSFATLNGTESNASAPYTAGARVVVVGTRDASGAKLYVNGTKGTDGATGTPAAIGTAYPFTIGRVSNNLWKHLGHIGYIAIYPGVLTTTQRQYAESTLKTAFGIS